MNESLHDRVRIVELPRGGTIVSTPAGQIQVGAPPETIKDTLVTAESVPRIFVLPKQLFHWQKGINVGDMEFPIYFNYFIKQQKVRICCTPEQGARLSTALQESVFGPEDLDLSRDVFEVDRDVEVPDIREELAFFRGDRQLSDLFELILFDDDGKLTIDDVTIRHKGDRFIFSWPGVEPVSLPDTVTYTAKYDIGRRLSEPFVPPRFAVTCLGPSHGFDPHDNTSGFVIWLNHSGIMVDPPVNCTEWLEKSNVNPKFIDSIILTHCHADHDAGTFQKILQEGRVTIYTTPTVMSSFLRKYSAFSGESPEFLEALFDFHPVYMGRNFYLHGGEFEVYYSLHAIPTMAFRLRFQDKSFVYSSDHQNDPEIHRQMFESGVIDEKRYGQLQNFPWDSDVIYHDAGIAPLHTPVRYLSSLPVDIQRKIVCFHIARRDFPEKTDLSLAKFGIENTLYFDARPAQYEEAYRVLDVLKQLDFSRDLSIAKAQQFFGIVERKTYSAGDRIIERGSRGQNFFIIMTGNAAVVAENLVRGKMLSAYDYFGEVALMTNSLRTADVVAESDVEVLAIERSRFLNFISGTEFETVLRRLIRNRSEETWNLLAATRQFEHLTDYQRMWLESVLIPVEFSEPGDMIVEGQETREVYLIRDGVASVESDGSFIRGIGRGDLAGDLAAVHRGAPAPATVRHDGRISAFALKRDDIVGFLDRNPGVVMRAATDFETESSASAPASGVNTYRVDETISVPAASP